MNALDTNVLIYACDGRDPVKQERALALIETTHDCVLLWQFACEFVAASRKLVTQGFSPDAAWARLQDFAAIMPLIPPSTAALHPAARAHVAETWDAAWSSGLWAASWSKSLEGLTAAKAAWPPAPGRHSIWQHVLHMVFWRENWLRRAATGVKPTPDEIAQLNFPDVADASEPAWAALRARFADSQSCMAGALRDPDPANDPLVGFLAHDCYHFGQINLLRALQGLVPID